MSDTSQTIARSSAVPSRFGTVTAIQTVTPMMRRITLGGPDIASFAVAPGALGPYLKLIFPCDEAGGRQAVRTYSIRRFDPERPELDVDVVLHGDGGIGSGWAGRTRVGDTVRLAGPGHIPADRPGAYLVAGDHTALPAIAHILDHLRAGCRVSALVEVPGPAEEQPLATRADLDLTWLHRRADEPSRLVAAFRSLARAHGPDTLVWAGAEAMLARAIRRCARTEMQLAPERVQVLNYWKAGQPEGGYSYMD